MAARRTVGVEGQTEQRRGVFTQLAVGEADREQAEGQRVASNAYTRGSPKRMVGPSMRFVGVAVQRCSRRSGANALARYSTVAVGGRST